MTKMITRICCFFLVFLLAQKTGFAIDEYESGYITVAKDVQIFYQKIGSSGSALLVPGGFFLFEDFKRLAQGRTVIFYDMRNRGRSTYVKDSMLIGIDRDVEDLEAVRSFFRIEKADLLGWSYLGLMVMLYTQQFPHHVNKVIQIGAAPLKWNEQFADSLTYKVPAEADTLYLPVIEAAYKAGMHERDPRKFSRLIFELLERDRLVGEPDAVARMGCQWGEHVTYANEQYKNFRRHMQFLFGRSIQQKSYREEDFRKIRNPVLVIHGTRDRNVSFGSGKQWAERLPNARLVRIEKAGHIPWVEQPDLVYTSIAKFLD